MALFHYVETLTNDAGDILVGYYVKLKNSSTGSYATLYSDASSTPIVTVSGIADTGISDSDGVVSIYVADGTYDIEVFDKTDSNLLLTRILAFPMYGFDSASDALAASASATAAATSETNAATSATAAAASATAAAAAETAAEAARDAAIAGANIYADTAAGLAAVASGEYFQIPSADAAGYVDLYLDNAGTADYVDTLPNLSGITPSALAAMERSLDQWTARPAYYSRPTALVVALVGQSLNAERGTALTDTVSPPNCFMPVGGPSAAAMDFFATNADYSMDQPEIASFVQYAVGTGETTISGMLNVIAPHFGRVYVFSCAIGSRSFLDIACRGQIVNYHYYIQEACAHARAAGYRPVVAIVAREGEKDASDGNSQATVESRGDHVFRRMQMIAARAMGEPDFRAPIFSSRIVQCLPSGDGSASRAVHKAFDTFERTIPNFTSRAQYHVRMETDRTHPEETGYRQNGECDGYEILDFFVHGIRRKGLTSRVLWDGGTNVRIVFSEPVTDKASSGADNGTGSTNINTTGQWKGFQWYDNGSNIALTLTTLYSTHADLTLATTPSGSLAQQVVRQACQPMTNTLTAGHSNVAGSTLAANDNRNMPTIIEAADATFVNNFRFLVPTEIQVEAM